MFWLHPLPRGLVLAPYSLYLLPHHQAPIYAALNTQSTSRLTPADTMSPVSLPSSRSPRVPPLLTYADLNPKSTSSLTLTAPTLPPLSTSARSPRVPPALTYANLNNKATTRHRDMTVALNPNGPGVNVPDSGRIAPCPPVPSIPQHGLAASTQRQSDFITLNRPPRPEELCMPKPGEVVKGYYTVFTGRECGIFFT